MNALPPPPPAIAPIPTLIAQATFPREPVVPSNQPLPELKPQPLPPVQDLNVPPPVSPEGSTEVPARFQITGYRLEAKHPIFSQAEIDRITQEYTGDISFAQLQQAAIAITQHYVQAGYITTGAYIPAGTVKDGVVTVQVVEGYVAESDIRVRFKPGTKHRLKPSYIRRRLAIATDQPLQRQRLLEALQLLKLNPLIQDVKADLSAGGAAGQGILDVEVVEGKTLSAQALLDNGRSPSVGSFRRQLGLTNLNTTGNGDRLALFYTNTDGSHQGDFSYSFPITPRNGTLSFNFGLSASRIIEEPFDFLDIRSNSKYFELSYRQPILQTPAREFALGITASHQYSRATLVDGEIPFPVPGSDPLGRTKVNALRFFQDYVQRRDRSVFALRSQFSAGFNVLGATENERPPDGRFFAWRGQAQWARLLAPETVLLLRSDVQLASRALVPLEQFGIGGSQTGRGYRQDAALGDNGLFASAEVQIPVWRLPKLNGLLQVAPFVEVGKVWSSSGLPNPEDDLVASGGVGLRLNLGDRLSARFDWGIPFIKVENSRDTWQERGLYFSVIYNFL
jgi:hemolysin activation/secretion protein